MKFLNLFLALFFLIGTKQYAYADAAIFSGSDVKILKSNLDFNGGIKVLSASTDPTASATDSTRGSILCNTGGGNCYVKQDSGSSTNWNRLIFGNSSGIVGLAQGGSAKALTASAGSVLYSDSDSFEMSAVGTSGQVLLSGGTGAPTWSSTITSPTLVTATASGDLTLSGGGIKFPSTQVSSANTNTLDDYEEGTFTPTVTGGTNGLSTGTYSSQVGEYTKIGNLVAISITLAWSAHNGTGRILVSNLPFALKNTSGLRPTCSYWIDNLALTASNVLQIFGDTNSTTMSLYQYPVGGGSASTVAMDTSVSSLYLSCVYQY